LRWADASTNALDLTSNGEAEVEVWVDLIAGESLTGLGFANTATTGIEQNATDVGTAGWTDGSTNGVLGGAAQWMSFASTGSGYDLTGPGSFLLGTQAVRAMGCVEGESLEISIDHATVLLLRSNGNFFNWDARYSTSNPGFAAYGDYGNPGWGTDPGEGEQPTPNPLIIHCVAPVAQEDCTTLPERAYDLLESAPGLSVYTETQYRDAAGCLRPVSFYGKAMASAASADAAVEAWFAEWGGADASSNAFGIEGLDLRLLRSNAVGVDGAYTVFAYQQYLDDLPVDGGQFRMVVKEVGGNWNVYSAAGRLTYAPPGGLRGVELTGAEAIEVAAESVEYGFLGSWSEPEQVIWTDEQGAGVRAWKFRGSGADTDGLPVEYTFYVDSQNGNLLGAYDAIHDAGVTGKVRGYIIKGHTPFEEGAPQELTDLRGVRVFDSVAALSTHTAESGSFELSGDVGTFGLNVELSSPWASVFSESDAEIFAVHAVPAGGSIVLTVNSNGAALEYPSAALSAYFHVTNSYWFYKSLQPAYQGLDEPVRINVNIYESSCNANYREVPPRLTFGSASEDCANTAISTVISHEFGHRVSLQLRIAGEGRAAFGEGFSDALAMLIHDRPTIAEGLRSGAVGRDYRCHEIPPCQCPSSTPWEFCGNEYTGTTLDACDTHKCGYTLAGLWWDIKGQLEAKYGKAAGREQARQLFTDWSQMAVPLPVGLASASRQTVGEILVADACAHGNCELGTNGAVDVCEICRAARIYGIACPSDVTAGADGDSDGVPDYCENCNSNSLEDRCDVPCSGPHCVEIQVEGGFKYCRAGCDVSSCGLKADCNGNKVPDECEVASHCSTIGWVAFNDCDGNCVPDDCDVSTNAALDVNSNMIPDSCEVCASDPNDCNGNNIPDACEEDCNGNGVPDDCDIAGGAGDCDSDGLPDVCEARCIEGELPDVCLILAGTEDDCNNNGLADHCETDAEISSDCNGDHIPDECQGDCNYNDIPDPCDISDGTSEDCNTNGVPDECDLLYCASRDCNTNGIPDSCDAASCATPPELVALASAACHGSYDCPANRYIEFCLDPITGGVEPRTQVYHDLFSGDYGMFLRATFDRPMAVGGLPADWRCLVPDPGVTCVPSSAGVDDEVVEIRFTTNGAMAQVPAGSYYVDLTGITSTNGVQLSGGCASFPICFVPGDVSRDGVLDWQDVALIQDNLGSLANPLIPPAADLDRDSIVAVSPSDIAPGDLPWLISTQFVTEVTCTTPCSPPGACDFNYTDSNTNGTPDKCEDCDENGIPDGSEVAAGSSCDSNTNGRPDECDIPDWDMDGDVDLRDYAAFQRCFDASTNGACLATFDHATTCGSIDLADYAMFADQFVESFSGGGLQGLMAGGSESSSMAVSNNNGPRRGAYRDSLAEASPARIGTAGGQMLQQGTTASLSIELQPVGGGPPVNELQPETTYELHYATSADGASLYVLTVQGAHSAEALASASAPVSGAWSTAGNFVLVDLADLGGYPPVVDSASGMIQIQLVMDDFGSDLAHPGPDAGVLCTVTTGNGSELRIEILMSLLDESGAEVMSAESLVTWEIGQ
jgi:hypothetical protein